MTEFIISSEQLERIIEAVEHDTGREINRLVIDGVRAREIVRCRDCERYRPREGQMLSCRFEYKEFTQWRSAEPDGFCAWGKRKEGGDDRPGALPS